MTRKVVLTGEGKMMLVTDQHLNPEEMERVKQEFLRWKTSGMPMAVFPGVSEIVDARPANERPLKVLITKDRSSKRYHIRVRDESRRRMLVDERCNTDQSGRYDIVDMPVVDAKERALLCRFCFEQ